MHSRLPDHAMDLEDSTHLITGRLAWYAYYRSGLVHETWILHISSNTNYDKLIRRAYHKRLKHLKIVREAINAL